MTFNLASCPLVILNYSHKSTSVLISATICVSVIIIMMELIIPSCICMWLPHGEVWTAVAICGSICDTQLWIDKRLLEVKNSRFLVSHDQILGCYLAKSLAMYARLRTWPRCYCGTLSLDLAAIYLIGGGKHSDLKI